MSMRFRARVKKADGTEETRVMEAPSRFSVYEQMETESGAVLSLEEASSAFVLPPWLSFQIGTGIKIDKKIMFTKNLSAMLSAGLTLSRALSVVERQSGNKYLKRVVTDLEEQVKRGSAFHEALAAHPNVFSKLFIAMTKAGEESGTLANSLSVVGHQMERSHTLAKKIKGAMIYPAIIVIAIIVIAILMLLYVVPTLSATFVSLGVDLPLSTRVIVATSNFMLNHLIVVLGGMTLLIALGTAFLRSERGSNLFLRLALRIPVIGELVRESYSARAARSLASLLASGVEMLSALAIAEEVVGTTLFSSVVADAKERVRKGEALSVAFAAKTNLYPVMFSDMIAVGEETGKVADMLGQVAEYYETDVEDKTKDLSTVIEPVLMLLIGSVVGVFALSMISPIYSLSSKI